MSDPVRVRFAPSPTGFLHVGGARTALFNWLYARKHNGAFVLRIEDTDEARNTDEANQVIFDGLRWLGLLWDEGPDIGGDYGPYRQSERRDRYEDHFETLKAGGHLYEDEGTWRFRSPRQPVTIEDEVCGNIVVDRSMEPDMTLRRKNGSFIFHFVNVIDDSEMKISHVIRGEDHLTNTAKHIEIYNALGITPPKFAHIPLILNRDGSKMSKRDAGSSIREYVQQGYVPEAVRNYLCLLGWSPKDNREKLDIEEVIALFDLDKINRRNAAFDLDKCFWLNGQYLIQMSLERFRELAIPELEKAGIEWGDDDYLMQVLPLAKEKIKHLTDLPDWLGYFFTETFPYDEKAIAKVMKKEGALDRLAALQEAFANQAAWETEALELSLKQVAEAVGCKTGDLVHPARVAVSGRSVGPSLYHMLEVLGQERVLQRFERARKELAELVAGNE